MATQGVIRTLRHSLFALTVLLVPAWVAPALAAEGGSPPVQLSKQERTDLEALSNEAPPGMPYRLDMANPLHYRITVDALQRGGKTPERSPQLFKTLAAAHEAGTATLKKSGANPPRALAATDATEPARPQDLNFIATFSQDNSASAQGKALAAAQPGYQATGISSVTGGSTTTSIVMELYEVETGKVYASQSETQYGQGTDFRVQVTGQVPSPNNNPTTTAQGLFVYYPKDGGSTSQPVVYVQSFQDTLNPSSACMNQPNYCVRDQSNNCTSTQQTSCTNTKANTTPIKLCWYRGSQQECDYWNSNAHPTDFVFPLSGSATFPNTVVSPPAGVTSIYIQNPNGGGCNVYFQQGTVLDPTYWKVEGQTISWNYPASAFPNNKQCINYYDGTTAYLWMTAYVGLNGFGDQAPPFGTLNFTSDRSQLGIPGVNIIPPLYIMQGCLATGTPITLADGSERPVEAFTGNQTEVVKTAHGQTRKVRGTTQGSEPHPMIRIKTDGGQSVLMTRTHPVILADGVPVQARALRVGDVVTTLNGTATITGLTQEEYAGLVHNLMVEEHPSAGTYYAGGILTGDANMQQSLATVQARVLSRSPAEIRASLPEEWRQDFDNDR